MGRIHKPARNERKLKNNAFRKTKSRKAGEHIARTLSKMLWYTENAPTAKDQRVDLFAPYVPSSWDLH